MELKAKIKELVNNMIDQEKYFLVDIQATSAGSRGKLVVLLDGDEGIDIDVCGEVSRQLGQLIEEQDLMPEAYILEVSSPGIDFPLQSVRQYRKNIGREVKILLQDGKEVKGHLLTVDDTQVVIKEVKKIKGHKKPEILETAVIYENIKKTNVLVSFK